MVEQAPSEQSPAEKPAMNQTIQSLPQTPEKASAKKSVDAKSNAAPSPSPGRKSFLQSMIEGMSPGANETAEAN